MKRFVIPASCILIAAATGITLAAPQAADSRSTATSEFRVEVDGDLAIKVDVSTGKTWILKHSCDESVAPFWFPIQQGDQTSLKTWHEQEKYRIQFVSVRNIIQEMEINGQDRISRDYYEELQKKLQKLLEEEQQAGD